MDDIKFMTGLNVEPVVVAEVSVQQAIAKYYGTSGRSNSLLFLLMNPLTNAAMARAQTEPVLSLRLTSYPSKALSLITGELKTSR